MLRDELLNGAISLGLILYNRPTLYQFSLGTTLWVKYKLPFSPWINRACEKQICKKQQTVNERVVSFFMKVHFKHNAKMHKYRAKEILKKCKLRVVVILHESYGMCKDVVYEGNNKKAIPAFFISIVFTKAKSNKWFEVSKCDIKLVNYANPTKQIFKNTIGSMLSRPSCP